MQMVIDGVNITNAIRLKVMYIMQMVIDGANITNAIRLEVMYFPSNGAIANVVHRDFDLYFHSHTNSGNHVIFDIWKTVRVGEKYSSKTFIEVDFCHRMNVRSI